MKGKDKELFDLVEEKNKLANEMKVLLLPLPNCCIEDAGS